MEEVRNFTTKGFIGLEYGTCTVIDAFYWHNLMCFTYQCKCGHIYTEQFNPREETKCVACHIDMAEERWRLENFRFTAWFPKEYMVWKGIFSRCYNPTTKGYHRYGGRGIKVCERWRSFINFLDDMGERPEGMTLDRINNDGDYEPGNCRWATYQQQAQNKSTNVNITINGETHCLAEWSRRSGISDSVLRKRLNDGWDHNDLLKPTR